MSLTKGRRISQYVNSVELLTQSTELTMSGNYTIKGTGLTITLPPDPQEGTWINLTLIDGTDNFTINGNGKNINGRGMVPSVPVKEIKGRFSNVELRFSDGIWRLNQVSQITEQDVEDIVADVAIRMAIVFS